MSSTVNDSANVESAIPEIQAHENHNDQIITINVGGQEFTTFISTLTSESKYFAALFSKTWKSLFSNLPKLRGNIFIDANAKLFEHLLTYFQRLSFPLFWTRESGYDYAMYAALQQEARFFGVDDLEKWISDQKYLELVVVKDTMDLALARSVPRDLNRPEVELPIHYDNTTVVIGQSVVRFTNDAQMYFAVTKRNVWFPGQAKA